MKQTVAIVSCLLALGACSEIPKEAYYNRGSPESLLDVSSEVVNVSLTSRGSLSELSGMLAQDPPARAELHCSPNDGLCVGAKGTLDKFKVPAQYADAANGQANGSQANGVTLIYERVVARDCEQRYIDNSINPYNLNHPTFGCANAANMVQQVSDKRQFSNPSLLDFQDGEKAVQVYRKYLSPETPPAPTPTVSLIQGANGS